MVPTLQDADGYLLNRWIFHVRSPRRTAIMVLQDPADHGFSVTRIKPAAFQDYLAAAARDHEMAEVLAQQDMQRMRILLQQKETGLYFKDVGTWVPNSAEAMDFVSSSAAIDFCVLNKLNDVQLVFK